jgi:hypothetical protein
MGTLTSTFLTADAGFLTGMASAVALSGNFYEFNASTTPAEADIRALQSDWSMIGQDLSEAMGHVAQEETCLKRA